MRTLANFIVKPLISPGSFVLAVLTGNLLVDGHWLVAAATFSVGIFVLGAVAIAAGEGRK